MSRLSGRRLARGPDGGGRSEWQNKVFSSHVTPGVFVHLERQYSLHGPVRGTAQDVKQEINNIYISYNREDQKRFQKAKRVGGLTFLAFLILLHAPERVGDASELPARHDVSNSRSVPLN